MRRRRSLALLLVSACPFLVPPVSASAQQVLTKKGAPAIEAELRRTIEQNIRGAEAEDVDAMMKTIHSGSPLYQTTRQQVSQFFGRGLNLKYQLVSLKYLATDGEFAFARVRQRTTRTPADPFFRNNEMDMIVAFRKEDDAWKFWTQAILEIKYLGP
jgi:hypothetical protein